MISWLLRNALSVGVFAVVVIFQPELRRLLEQIDKGNSGSTFLRSAII